MNPRIDLNLPLVLTLLAIAQVPVALLLSLIGVTWVQESWLEHLGFVVILYSAPPFAVISIVVAVLYFVRQHRIQEILEVVVLIAWLWLVTHLERF